MPALVVDKVSKHYGTRSVLRDVSFTAKPGELVLVSGRSGSGKSTLMSILAGLKSATSGDVRVGGTDVATMDEEARAAHRLRNLGIVFQDFQLFPDLTVHENVMLPLRLAKRRKDLAAKRAHELLERLGMADRADDFPETLSGGEQQRTSIARALANEPMLVLADEATANLDAANAHNVLKLLQEVAAEGRAVVLASHDPLARGYASVHHTIDDGVLVRTP